MTDQPSDHPPPDPATTTPDLLRRARSGDGPAVQTLLQRYLPGLRAFVRLHANAVVRARESCSDLVQSACREVLQNVEQFQYGGEAGFKRWLYRTALRKIAHRREYWRADRRAPQREAREASGHTPDERELLGCYAAFYSPSQQAAAREELERVEAAFDQLSPDHREVIVLAKIVGLSRAEIAIEMGRTEIAVRALLSRALAQLAEEIVRPSGPTN